MAELNYHAVWQINHIYRVKGQGIVCSTKKGVALKVFTPTDEVSVKVEAPQGYYWIKLDSGGVTITHEQEEVLDD